MRVCRYRQLAREVHTAAMGLWASSALLLNLLVVSLTHGHNGLDQNLDYNVGVGTAEEVPISSLTLSFAPPAITIRREFSHQVYYDTLEDEEYEEDEDPLRLSKGSVEPIPIDSMRVKFESRLGYPAPLQHQQRPACGDQGPDGGCQLPPLPPAMLHAARTCGLRVIPHAPWQTQFKLLEARGRLNSPLNSKLDARGVPRAEHVVALLQRHARLEWAQPLHRAYTACHQPLAPPPPDLTEREKCQLSSAFMRCIAHEMGKNCPPHRRIRD